MMNSTSPLLNIIVYCPPSHLQRIKQALFDAGAGTAGRYDNCCWETSGMGQFKAQEGAAPFIGKIDTLQKTTEIRLEMICKEANIVQVITALKRIHPYEQPAYHVYSTLQY